MCIRDSPEAQLVVVGDGPDRSKLEDLVAQREVRGVTFAGTQPGTWAMCAFDVFLLPSRYEGFPYVLIEAAHLGIPIVASTESNSSYLAARYSKMVNVEGADAAAMAAAVAEFVDTEVDAVDGATGGLGEFLIENMATAVEKAYS